MHMTFDKIEASSNDYRQFSKKIDLDEAFFYSVPTSFFVVDSRIPLKIRELITEAEGCKKMNFLTGASACTRKAIYELLSLHEATGPNYDDKIKSLQSKHPDVDDELFEVLKHVKDMTSEHVHEDSCIAWSAADLNLFLVALKAVLHEIYVTPDEKRNRIQAVRALKEDFRGAQKE